MTRKKEQAEDPFKGIVNILDSLGKMTESLGALADKGQALKQELAPEKMDTVEAGSAHPDIIEMKQRLQALSELFEQQKPVRSSPDGMQSPKTETFKVNDNLVIEIEVPGIGLKDVNYTLRENDLTISAQRGKKRYQTHLNVEKCYQKKEPRVTCKRGVLTITFFPDTPTR